MLPEEPEEPDEPEEPEEPDEPDEPEEPDEPDEPDEPELEGKGMDPPPLALPLEPELLLSGLPIGEVDPQAASNTAAHNAASRCIDVLDLFTIITQ
jgi:hypothetical protein